MRDAAGSTRKMWNADRPTGRLRNVSSSVIVLGIGNPLLSDDGLGIHALRYLKADTRVPSGTRLLDGGTFGPELLAQVYGCRRLLLLDAIEVGSTPGTIVRVALDGICTAARKTSVHEFGINELLDDLRLLGEEPEQALILGIQPASVAIGTMLSREVLTALPALIDAALSQLMDWNEDSGKPPNLSGRTECEGPEWRGAMPPFPLLNSASQGSVNPMEPRETSRFALASEFRLGKQGQHSKDAESSAIEPRAKDLGFETKETVI